MLTMQEALTSFGSIAELPSVENFISILQTCRKEKELVHAKGVHMHICGVGLDACEPLGNYLVPVFVECVSIPEAQQVFNKLVHRSEHSFTSLMQGYIECGEPQRALNLFHSMDENVVNPSKFTYVSVLKACARLHSLESGGGIHSEVIQKGLESDLHVGSTLVDMYAKCGLLAEAQEVFDNLPNQGVITWTALMAGYAEHGLGEEALNCFKHMQLEGMSLDAVTFVCILKACACIGTIEWGQEIHTEVAKEGFERDLHVGNTLVNMYANCELLAEAREVFDMLLVRDVVSWNALMTGYVECGLGTEVLNCLEGMQLEGVFPDVVTFSCSLKACGSMRAFGRGNRMHSEIAKKGFERDLMVSNTLVDMYAKCGHLTDAWGVFVEMPVPDIVSWNAIISGYAEHGLGVEALKCLKQMQLQGMGPNLFTLVSSLKACGSIAALDRGQQLHIEIAKEGFDMDPLVGNALVDMYAKCGSLREVQKVFDLLVVRDVFSWNTLITGYAEQGLGHQVPNCLQQLQLEGVAPNVATFVCILKACGSEGAIERCREVHIEIVNKGLEAEAFIASTLVDAYAKCGSLLEAWEVFSKLRTRDVVSWTALVAGYAEHGLVEKAQTCLDQMQYEGVSPNVVSWSAVILAYAEREENEMAFSLYAQMQEQGLLPNTVTLISILKACGKTAALETGKKVHAQSCVTNGLEASDTMLRTALIDMYGKCGSMVDAHRLFNAICTRDLVRWNATIAGYACQGETELVFHLFERMMKSDIQPNEITFLSVLAACSHAGLKDKGQKCFEDMINNHHISATTQHYTCMVDLLGRAGQLDEAVVMLEKVPFQLDLALWNILLSSCQKWGNLELGTQAFGRAVSMNETHATTFILLSNIYADMYMWENTQIVKTNEENILAL